MAADAVGAGRSRAGNAMGRTRDALLLAAVDVIARAGLRRTTMGDIAAAAGVAKATLYNHFRTKDDVVAAAASAALDRLAEDCARTAARDGLEAALAEAASTLAAHPAVRRLAADEPGAIVALLGPDGAGGERAAAAVDQVATAAGAELGVAWLDVVRRWVASYAVDPGSAETIAAGARTLAATVLGQNAEPRE